MNKKTMGVWIFLCSEVLLFGVLILLYLLFYGHYREDFKSASGNLHFIHGTVNTVVLLTSSYFVALAQVSKEKRWLAVAVALGLIFLGIKGSEWYDLTINGKFPLNFGSVHGPTKLFLSFYAYLTFLHAVHVLLGIFALVLVLFLKREDFEEGVGLYWHFVDIVWVFLYPIFYLVRP